MPTKFHVLGGTLFHTPYRPNSCAEEAAGTWKRCMNGSRWAGRRTNAMSRLKPSRPSADLAGLTPREIVRRLPAPGLNKLAARARA